MASLSEIEPQIEQARAWMTPRFVVALVLIGALTIGSFVFFQLAVANSSTVAGSIEFLGRQRIMLERSALYLNRMQTAPNRFEFNAARAGLIDTIDILEKGHRGLAGAVAALEPGEPWKDKLRESYFGPSAALNDKMWRYISQSRELTGMSQETIGERTAMLEALSRVAAPSIESELAEAMALLQQEGGAALSRIQNIQFGVLISIIALLVLEGLLIFRPMILRVDEEIRRNAAISAQLRKAADTLEEEVRARTADLNAAREDAERANLAKSRFLAAAGHDLLQPLEAIGLFAGALERSAIEDRTRLIISDLRDAQRSMRRLLNSLLDMSQIEAGVIEPAPDVVALDPLLQLLHAEFEPLAAQKKLKLKTLKTGADVMADRLLLERILRNLIANAIRYTDHGRVTIGARRGRDHVRIEVHDTGPGIAEADLQRIFTEFHQLNDPGRDKSEGLGLGLTIAQRFAEMMDMTLSARSTPGKGSTFTLDVPLA